MWRDSNDEGAGEGQHAALVWLRRIFGDRNNFVSTKNSEITVFNPPRGPGWQWLEDRREGDGFRLSEIKFRHADENGVLLFYAKDYSGTQRAVEELAGRDWRAYYRQLFSRCDELAIKPSPAADGTVYEALAGGLGPEGGPLRLRERTTAVRDHMLIVSAAGSPAGMTRREAEVQRWFTSVVFDAMVAR